MEWYGNEDAGDARMMADADASEHGLYRLEPLFCTYTGEELEWCECPACGGPRKRAWWHDDPIAKAERAFGC